jgi:hypothetical protein
MAPRPIANAAAIGMTTAGSVTLDTTLDVLPSSARQKRTDPNHETQPAPGSTSARSAVGTG